MRERNRGLETKKQKDRYTGIQTKRYYQGLIPWDFFGRNDAKAETPVLWPPHAKSWLIGKTLMLGGIRGRRKRGRQDEMAGWSHRLDGHEFE